MLGSWWGSTHLGLCGSSRCFPSITTETRHIATIAGRWALAKHSGRACWVRDAQSRRGASMLQRLLRDIGVVPGDRPANPNIIFFPYGTVQHGMNSCFPIIGFFVIEEHAFKAAI